MTRTTTITQSPTRWDEELTVPFDTVAQHDAGRRRHRRRLVVVLMLVLAVLLSVAGAWLIRFSTVFDVETVAVQRPAGALLTEKQITTRAQIPLGGPLAALDLQAVATRVATLPEVAEVTVSAHPPHTVRIEITERTAAYALRADDAYELIDPSGVGFHRVTKVPTGLAAVTADQADRSLRTGLADVVAALPTDVRGRLSRIEAPTRDQVTLRLTGGVTVVWGSPEQSALKSQIAVVLLKVKGVRTVDVSAPANPTTR